MNEQAQQLQLSNLEIERNNYAADAADMTDVEECTLFNFIDWIAHDRDFTNPIFTPFTRQNQMDLLNDPTSQVLIRPCHDLPSFYVYWLATSTPDSPILLTPDEITLLHTFIDYLETIAQERKRS